MKTRFDTLLAEAQKQTKISPGGLSRKEKDIADEAVEKVMEILHEGCENLELPEDEDEDAIDTLYANHKKKFLPYIIAKLQKNLD